MRHYEVVFLVHPDQSEQVPAMIERYQAMVTSNGGQIHRVEDWGRRQLAFPIAKVHKAHYILLNIETDQKTLAELNIPADTRLGMLRENLARAQASAAQDAAAPAITQAFNGRWTRRHWAHASLFAVMGALLAIACGIYELGAWLSGNTAYRAGFAIAVLAGLEHLDDIHADIDRGLSSF